MRSIVKEYRFDIGGRTLRKYSLIMLFICLGSSAIADDIPLDERPLLEAMYAQIWGKGAWDRPQATRAEALTAFNQTLGKVKSDAAVATVWELRADYFRATGDLAESVKASKLIYDKFPKSTRHKNAAEELIVNSSKMGDYQGLLDLAQEQLEKATEPARIVALTNYVAIAQIKLGRSQAGIEEMFKLLNRMPEQSKNITRAIQSLSADAIGRGEHELADTMLTKIYAITPPERRDAMLLGNLATISVLRGNRENAVKYHLEALEQFPDDPRRVSHEFSLGVLLLDMGQAEKARHYFQAVVNSPAKFDGLEKIRSVSRESLKEMDALKKSRGEPVQLDSRTETRNNRRITLAYVLLFNGIGLALFAGFMWWRKIRKSN